MSTLHARRFVDETGNVLKLWAPYRRISESAEHHNRIDDRTVELGRKSSRKKEQQK